MYHPTFPKDSVLIRHFDSMVEMQREAWLKHPPSDSILHRHYLAANLDANIRASQPPRKEPRRASTITHPAEASRPVTAAPGGGFFGWLFGLFGRRA